MQSIPSDVIVILKSHKLFHFQRNTGLAARGLKDEKIRTEDHGHKERETWDSFAASVSTKRTLFSFFFLFSGGFHFCF